MSFGESSGSIIVVCILILLLILFVVGIFFWIQRVREHAEKNMNDVVDSVNSVNYYTYTYEKKQNDNLKKVDAYVRKVDYDMGQVKQDIKTLNDTKASLLDIYKLESDKNNFTDIQLPNFSIATSSNVPTGTPTGTNNDTSLYQHWIHVQGTSSNALGMSMKNIQITSNMYLTGNMIIEKGISSAAIRNQPFIEYNDPVTRSRFGIGHYDPGTTRIYSADKINLSKAKGDGTFSDIIEMRDSKVDVKAPAMCMGSMCFVPNNTAMMLCPSDNPIPTNPRCKQISSL